MSAQRGLPVARTALRMIVTILLLVPGALTATEYKSLYAFDGGAGGRTPSSGLTFDASGNIYGTTVFGGAYQQGTVFKLTPQSDGSWVESLIYVFTGGDDGAYPSGNLVFDAVGNLYGTTQDGAGAGQVGNVFRLTPNSDGSWTEKTLYAFCSLNNCVDGLNPSAGVIFDNAGNLYGTTAHGGAYGSGTVFKLEPRQDGMWTETVLHSFTGRNGDGASPFSGLVSDKKGSLYGATASGGVGGSGTVFEITPEADGEWNEKVLHRFIYQDGAFPDEKDGWFPDGTLIFDSSGKLYGTAEYGGNPGCVEGNGCGVIFSLTPNSDGSWTEKLLHRFTSGAGGSNPLGALIFDAAGILYGTTFYRGPKICEGYGGCGVVFKLVPNSKGGWDEIVLHSFHDHPGANPSEGVILDADGNIYGITEGDYFTTFGSVFEITP